MRCVGVILCTLVLLGGAGVARAEDCPGNPNAIGTSRTIVVDPTEHPRVGTMQYPQTLPLADHEVVLTFDDGPLPRYSKQVLAVLASQCVKATYFLVGKMAQSYPEMVREIRAAGHSIGTHSWDHPLSFQRMGTERVDQEVQGGIDAVKAALGDEGGLSPFFRIPGLLRAAPVENYLEAHGIMTWSADFPADDWKHISAAEVTRRALMRLEAHGKGILLLHDIHANTATALPVLLRELKARGYHIVHVVAATPDRPATPTEVAQWYMHPPVRDIWPVVAAVGGAALPELAAPDPAIFDLSQAFAPLPRIAVAHRARRGRHARAAAEGSPPVTNWPRASAAAAEPGTSALPIPALQSFDFFDVLGTPSATSPLKAGTEPAPVPKATIEPPRPGTRADAATTFRLTVTAPLPEIGFP